MPGTIEERLRAVEDRFAIINLKAEYWNCCDGGWDRPSHNGDKVATLFTEDGIWEIGSGQVSGTGARLVGQAAIREGFNGVYNAEVPFAFHHGGTPLIRVDGDSAYGEWHLIGLLTHRDDGPLLAAIHYRDHFVRVGDEWRIRHMSLTPVFITPFSEGWARFAHLTAH